MTYQLGWSVITQLLVRRERWPGGYKIKGVPLVYPGQELSPDQPIIRIERPEKVEKSQYIDSMTSIPRLSLPSVKTPTSPEFGATNGNHPAGQGETVPAGLRGRVVDITRRGGVVIESRASVVQGTIGSGNQVAGPLTIWQGTTRNGQQQIIPPGAILVVPGPLNFTMLRQTMASGVAGIVASSIAPRDLEGFLRTDLVQLLNSVDVDAVTASLPPVTLLLTEGLGTIAMPARTINLLSQYQGSIALLSGITSVRQGIYPELIISLPLKEAQQQWHPTQPDPTLVVGAQVRVCSGEHEGAIGEVDYLFTHQQVFPSGARGRAARLRLEDGSTLIVPMTVIERIG